MTEPVRKRNNMINENDLPVEAARAFTGKRSILRKDVAIEENGQTVLPGGIVREGLPVRGAIMGQPETKRQTNVISRPTSAEAPGHKKSTPDGSEVGTTTGLAHAYIDKKNQSSKSQHGWRRTVGEAYRDIERTAGQGRREGYVSDRIAGHFARQMVKAPRYVKNTGSSAVGVYRNIRYLSKMHMDVKSGVVTAKEARIATLRRGSDALKEAGRATLSKIGRETSDFYGSDDLGVEAVRKPKDAIVNGYRILKTASGVTKAMAKAPKTAKKAIRGSAQAAKKMAEYTATAARTVTKTLSNPAALKSILIGLVGVLVAIMLMAVVSSISSVFASFTLTSNDKELTKTYAWMTELDADLNQQLAKIEDEILNIGVEQFHYRLDGSPVGHADMRVMTNTDYFLNYLDVKYKEYTLEGSLPFPESTVRDEVTALHQQLYTVTKNSWEERTNHVTVIEDPFGIEHEVTWTEVIDHLDVDMTTIPIEVYIEANKDTLFSAGQEEQYQALNEVGGMNLRQELGNPFPGYDWKSNLSVTTRFGWRLHPIDGVKRHHDGIDIGQPEGTPIQAVMGGTVTDVIFSEEGYGNRVVIASGDRVNLYAHCKEVNVTIGETIRRGTVIATVGNTGASTDPHLHIEYEKDGALMNPTFFASYD